MQANAFKIVHLVQTWSKKKYWKKKQGGTQYAC